MRTIPFVSWIANAAARWVGTHGTVTATAQQTGCSRQCVYDHAQQSPGRRRGRARRRTHPRTTDPGERRPPPGERPTLGLAVPDHRVPSGQATAVRRHGPGHGLEPQPNPRLAGHPPGHGRRVPVAPPFIAGSKPPPPPPARSSSHSITPAGPWCWSAVSTRSSSAAARSWSGSNPTAWCGSSGRRPTIARGRPGRGN